MRPDVSVIIPIYNKAKYLEACLESVLSQQRVMLEVICVDDASTDGSADIASQYAVSNGGLTLLRNETRRGAARSRNRGLLEAAGTWVQFTDADDLLPPGSLETLLTSATRTGAEVARGALHRIRNGNVDPWPGAGITAERSGTLLELPELWIPWFHTCYLISRDLLAGRDVRYPELSAGEDPVFLARVLTLARRICVVPTATYIYRQDEPRVPPTRRTVEDYLRHAELVKGVYAADFASCWDAYHPFVEDDLRLLLSQAALSPDEHSYFDELIARL